MNCIFVSDLHGNKKKYYKLFKIIEEKKPDAVFFGGDLLPNQYNNDKTVDDFIEDELFSKIEKIVKFTDKKIRFFVILGNDDPRIFEKKFISADEEGLIDYVNEKTVEFNGYFVTGYSYVPPTPFQLKDWEKYDVSRFVDVGSVSPEEGFRTVKVKKDIIKYSTIKEDLDNLLANAPADKTIFLFHSPPYNSKLDRAALDGESVDHAPVDVHIGSIAIQRFIKKKQPFLTLHGHVHESAIITGEWIEKKGDTYSFSAAHDGAELSIIYFDTNNLSGVIRDLIKI